MFPELVHCSQETSHPPPDAVDLVNTAKSPQRRSQGQAQRRAPRGPDAGERASQLPARPAEHSAHDTGRTKERVRPGSGVRRLTHAGRMPGRTPVRVRHRRHRLTPGWDVTGPGRHRTPRPLGSHTIHQVRTRRTTGGRMRPNLSVTLGPPRGPSERSTRRKPCNHAGSGNARPAHRYGPGGNLVRPRCDRQDGDASSSVRGCLKVAVGQEPSHESQRRSPAMQSGLAVCS